MPVVGSQSPQAKDGGTWKAWSRFWAKDGGTWKRPISVFVKSGGSWVEVWDEAPRVSNVSKQTIGYDGNLGLWVTQTSFTLYANGFSTTVTVDGTLQATEAADSVTSQSYQKYGIAANDYPVAVVANSSGSLTV